MTANVFISSSVEGRAGKGGMRAERDENGTWRTDLVFPELDVRCLAVGPEGGRSVWAGTQGQGIWVSKDQGVTWRQSGLEGSVVKAIAVSPHDPQLIYAGTKPALMYTSHDDGATWSELEGFREIPWRWLWVSPAEPPFIRAYVHAINVSPSDPNVVLAGIEAGALVRSTDGGVTWQGHRAGALRDCHGLTFHRQDGNWAYEAGAGRRPGSVSRDGGQSWRQPGEKVDRTYGWACAADPEQPEIWYVSASSGPGDAHSWDHANAHIYRVTGGTGWEKLAGGLPQPLDHLPTALITVPGKPGHVYAGLSNGDIWFSEDHGDDWNREDVNLKGIWHQLVML
jgi:hypothetical protein